jgi:AmmeMemoRadiSam system protein B
MLIHIPSSIEWSRLIYLLQPSKRVFILGPSHHVYLNGCALSKCTEYATPLGSLPLDRPSMPLFLDFSPDLTSRFQSSRG